jgi:predicted translin family RNA/ssDNA-binding protein
MDFPDAITHGLRRTADNTRGILEKTRGDLTLILKQKELEQKINQTTGDNDTLQLKPVSSAQILDEINQI